MASGSTAPFSGEFVDLENVPKLPEGISAEQIFEQNADAIRQAAEARFNAGLSQVNADGGFFDAFVDSSRVSSKSKVSVSNNNAVLDKSNLDGFEDGNLTEYSTGSKSNGTATINQTNPKNGNNCCEIAVSGSGAHSIERTINMSVSDGDTVEASVLSDRTDNKILLSYTNTQGDLFGSDAITVRLTDSGEFRIDTRDSSGGFTDSITFSTYDANEYYTVEINFDVTNSKITLKISDSTNNTIANKTLQYSGASNYDFVILKHDDSQRLNAFALFDDVAFDSIGRSNSGSLTEQQFTFTDTEGNAFSPSKVGIFPDQNLNGQSISYDLKDSTGTVVKTFNQADLNQLQSVNTTDTTFQVEANFSGNGSQTPELEFLDVRGV